MCKLMNKLQMYIYQNNNSFYLTDNLDICAKYLENVNYVLSEEEIENIIHDQFRTQNLYLTTYLSKCPINTLTQEAISDFETSIIVMQKIVAEFMKMPVKFRVKDFKDPRNFSIISDIKCNSPIEAAKSTAIVQGVKGKMVDNAIQLRFENENGDPVTEYTFNIKTDGEREFIKTTDCPTPYSVIVSTRLNNYGETEQ